MASLQELQRMAVRTMLNLNVEVAASGNSSSGVAGSGAAASGADATWTDKWKVLVYDKACRDVISPLLTVQKLRQLGVTLHMPVDRPRERISDVPAVYFLQPTLENVQRVADDCKKGLYDSVYINFASQLPRPQLEELAKQTGSCGTWDIVQGLTDQFLNFVCLEPSLFTLNIQSSYSLYANPAARDPQGSLARYVDGLFSAVVTLGIVPIIRSPAGGAAEYVAKKLDEKLRLSLRNMRTQHLFQRQGVTFSKGGSDAAADGVLQGRPVLLILDRDIDLAEPFRHTSLYQPLVHDLLELRLNRATMKISGDNGQTESKSFTVDPNVDTFWRENAGSLFPEAVAGNEAERSRLMEREQGIKAATSSGSVEGVATAVGELEKHNQDKQRASNHLQLLEATMSVVSTRHIPSFYEWEEQISEPLASSSTTAILDLISDPEKGSYADKVRIATIWIVRCEVPSEQLADIVKALDVAATIAGATPMHNAVFKHMMTVKRLSRPSQMLSAQLEENKDAATGDGNWFGTVMKDVGAVVSKVKRWIPRARNKTAISRITDAVCAGREDQLAQIGTGAFHYFDPMLGRTNEDVNPSLRQKTDFNSAMVFMIGGTTYTEVHDLRQYAAKCKPAKSIIFGTTEIVNAESLMQQVANFDATYAAANRAHMATGTVD